MAIRIGNSSIVSQVYVGTKAVKYIYVGTARVFTANASSGSSSSGSGSGSSSGSGSGRSRSVDNQDDIYTIQKSI